MDSYIVSLQAMLAKLIGECEEHNSEYHHITSKELLNEARALLGSKRGGGGVNFRQIGAYFRVQPTLGRLLVYVAGPFDTQEEASKGMGDYELIIRIEALR